jgi:uncharacterized membrane protein
MESIEKIVDVNCSIRSVYKQWTLFEEFPRFMTGVREVKQLDEALVRWNAQIWGKDKEWDAQIIEQIPDEAVSWKSVSGDALHAGTVRFEPIAANRTRVRLVMAYESRGKAESVGALGILSASVQNSVSNFKKFIEEKGDAAVG